jgi:catechol 2,3-dioxygenase-like lactoylglutathione lyase family enzyme
MPVGTREIIAMRPFVPAKDFETSLRFYTDLGFEPHRLGEGLASMHLGPFAFLLQDYYVKDWAENFMMHLLVHDLQAWWAHIASLNLADRYAVKIPAEPKLQPWGLVVGYVWDPCGVLWHVAGNATDHPAED